MQLLGFWLESFDSSFRQLNSSPASLSTFWEGCNRDLVNRDTYQLADREALMVAIFRVKYHHPPAVIVHSF